jgi:uncharacterized membrane protein
MKVARIALAVVGIVLVLYGGGRILFSVPPPILVMLGIWMVGALLIQHGLVSPLVVAVGVALRRVPDRGRRFLQVGLIVAAMVTAVAIPLILRQGTQPPAKALLLQNYAANLALLLGLIAVVTLAAYAVRVARDRRP